MSMQRRAQHLSQALLDVPREAESILPKIPATCNCRSRPPGDTSSNHLSNNQWGHHHTRHIIKDRTMLKTSPRHCRVVLELRSVHGWVKISVFIILFSDLFALFRPSFVHPWRCLRVLDWSPIPPGVPSLGTLDSCYLWRCNAGFPLSFQHFCNFSSPSRMLHMLGHHGLPCSFCTFFHAYHQTCGNYNVPVCSLLPLHLLSPFLLKFVFYSLCSCAYLPAFPRLPFLEKILAFSTAY